MKQDGRGRIRVLVERQEALLDEFEKSGGLRCEVCPTGGDQVYDFCGLGAEAAQAACHTILYK